MNPGGNVMREQLVSQVTHSDAVSGIASKLTVASGAGAATYGAVNGQTIITVLGLMFTAASFFLDWYSKRRSRALQQEEMEINAALQREKNERDYELQQQRLQMETHDREERRRIMEDAWSRAEKRRERQAEAMLAEVRKTGRPFFAPDSAMGVPFDMAKTEDEP